MNGFEQAKRIKELEKELKEANEDKDNSLLKYLNLQQELKEKDEVLRWAKKVLEKYKK